MWHFVTRLFFMTMFFTVMSTVAKTFSPNMHNVYMELIHPRGGNNTFSPPPQQIRPWDITHTCTPFKSAVTTFLCIFFLICTSFRILFVLYSRLHNPRVCCKIRFCLKVVRRIVEYVSGRAPARCVRVTVCESPCSWVQPDKQVIEDHG